MFCHSPLCRPVRFQNVRSSNTTSSVSLGPTPLCSTAALPYGAFAAAERAQYPGSRYTPPPHHHQAQHGAGARLYPPSDSPLGAAHMYAADGSGQPASKFGMAPQRPAVSGAMGDGHGGWTFGQVSCFAGRAELLGPGLWEGREWGEAVVTLP